MGSKAHKEKKAAQLGMNESTARGRLYKDILFKYVQDAGHNVCFQCGEEITREDFSIEHKIPWLDSEDPVDMFFNLDNIAFSHLDCNSRARRQGRTAVCGTISKYRLGCRCEDCKESWREYKRERYTPEERRNRYLKTGH